MIKTFTAKFGPMRKPQKFVVYPRKTGEALTIQSDKTIARFDAVTGEGFINFKGDKFMHLHPSMGAIKFIAGEDLRTLALGAENVTDANGAVKVLG